MKHPHRLNPKHDAGHNDIGAFVTVEAVREFEYMIYLNNAQQPLCSQRKIILKTFKIISRFYLQKESETNHTAVRPLLSAVLRRTKFWSQKPRINEVRG